MKKKTAYLLLAVAAAGLLLATACGSAKKNTKTGAYQAAETRPEEPRNTIEGEFAALANSYADWTDVSLPVKVQLNQPKRLSVSGTAKMVRGKALSVSLRIFGIEVGSMYADQDSVIVIAKFNNMYCSESLSQITATYGLTLADLQSVLLGQVFTSGKGKLSSSEFKKYKVELGENSISLTPKDMPKGLSWTFAASLRSDAVPSLRTLTVNAEGHEPVVAAYGTAQASGAGMAAPWVNITTKVRNNQADATLTWDLDKAKWDNGLNISKPRIPSGARKIAVSKIIEMLKK